jgi:chromosomal replication initiator protein
MIVDKSFFGYFCVSCPGGYVRFLSVTFMEKSTSEIAALWDRILLKIKDRMDDPLVYDSFFDGSYIDSIHGNQMIVVANSGLAVQILSTKYKDLIDEVVKEATESNFEIKFVKLEDVKKTVEAKPVKPAYFADSYLNPQYTFKTFVVGPSNREAYQASLMVSQNPGKLYNPILIYGDSGLGKTHLLHAIGNSIKEKFPNMRVLYVHAQEFLNEYVKYVTGDKGDNNIVDWFKDSVDVLLVDDVQFLVNKQKTEETFFSIYNNFYAAGKQVVLTSDQHPSKLNGLDERLKSRFVQGLPLSINAPEKETCESILRLRIEANGLNVSDFDPEVISYFADRFHKNVRELEGAFDRLLFYTVNIHPTKHVDLSTAMDSVQSLVDVQNDKTKLSEEKIINVAADYYNLAPYQLTGKIRTSQIALARHIAMYLIRTLLDVPFAKIGESFGGKDHATVMNGVSKVEKSLKEDRNLQKAISELESRLKA